MNFNHFANFILHEEITSKGKPLTDPDEKKDDQVPEFGNDEEIMDLESAKWLAYKLSDGCKEERLILKVMELVEVKE